MESVDPVAGVVLSDSLSAAKATSESRMLNRRRGNSPLSSGRGRQVVVPPLHCSRAAVLVALDGDVSPAAAGSRLLVSSIAEAASRRPRCRAFLSPGRRIVVLPVGRFNAAASFLLLGSRVKELLDALRHVATLVALELV